MPVQEEMEIVDGQASIAIVDQVPLPDSKVTEKLASPEPLNFCCNPSHYLEQDEIYGHYLPHSDNYRLLHRLWCRISGSRIDSVGTCIVPPDFCRGHFRDVAIVPGFLWPELVAHTAGAAILALRWDSLVCQPRVKEGYQLGVQMLGYEAPLIERSAFPGQPIQVYAIGYRMGNGHIGARGVLTQDTRTIGSYSIRGAAIAYPEGKYEELSLLKVDRWW